MSSCDDFYSFMPSSTFYLSPCYHPNTGSIHLKKNGLCATWMSPFFWQYKINSQVPSAFVFMIFCFFVFFSCISLLSEWGEICKNSVCEFWVSGPQGASLCRRFLRPSNKNSPWGGCLSTVWNGLFSVSLKLENYKSQVNFHSALSVCSGTVQI